jgi:hypothetical protein
VGFFANPIARPKGHARWVGSSNGRFLCLLFYVSIFVFLSFVFGGYLLIFAVFQGFLIFFEFLDANFCFALKFVTN